MSGSTERGFKIRKRDRIESSPKQGLDQGWTEYQVVAGRKIVGRYGTLAAARQEYPNAELDVSVLHETEIEQKRK